MPRIANSTTAYLKLEERLVLLAWLNSQLGYESNRELLNDASQTDEGFDASGRSYIYHLLEARGEKVKLSLPNLARYDDNIRPEAPKAILTMAEPARLYTLIADDSVVTPGLFSETALLQEACQVILRKYVDKFYRIHEERWDSDNMLFGPLDGNDANFQDYEVKIGRSETELIAAVQKLIDEADRVYTQELRELPSIHFDRHLYQPLLIERGDKIRSQPPGLNESERGFVDDLRSYCRAEKAKSLAEKEVFLLRNLSRGKGIGFFEKRGFYPDFILWIKDSKAQRIIFIEPHGMIYAQPYIHDDKARLHETLPALASALAARANTPNVLLDSFIVSATPYDELLTRYDDGTWDRKRFAGAHILYPERTSEYDYLATIIGSQ